VSLGLLLSVVALACGDDDDDVTSAGGGGHGGAGAAGGAQAQGGAGGEAPVCGTANGELPAGLTTLAWDDGVASTNLREQSFAITVDGDDFVLNEEPLHEAVRFDLDHPARVHGFSIRWGGLADDAPPTTELVAGLYGDFGYNGFDFWAPEPLFSGSRCAGDADDDGFVSYVFDEPIEIAHPGLIYVAHLAQPGEPVFDFDGTTANEEGSCALFDDCHSALNMPDALPFTYFNGVSFPFQYDFMVRLHVEYTDQVAPEEKIFQPLEPVAGAHASFGDIDADGDDDLITDGPTLWLNDGAGAFTDGTQASGIAALGVSATGGVFGDYDNDGCLDLFLYAESYTAPDVLLHNECDGTFTDRTAVAGISDVQSYEACGAPGVNVRSPTAAAAWLDIDADGFLDLFLANFICWDSGNTYVDEVWRNRGDGTFESWTATRGLSQLERASRGAAPVDADADGDVDLFVNTYRLQKNFFYDNLGDGTVAEVAGELGLGGEVSQGYYGHTIGGAWGDLDGDGRLDLVAANLAHPRFFDFSDKTQVLLQGSDGTFADLQGGVVGPAGSGGPALPRDPLGPRARRLRPGRRPRPRDHGHLRRPTDRLLLGRRRRHVHARRVPRGHHHAKRLGASRSRTSTSTGTSTCSRGARSATTGKASATSCRCGSSATSAPTAPRSGRRCSSTRRRAPSCATCREAQARAGKTRCTCTSGSATRTPSTRSASSFRARPRRWRCSVRSTPTSGCGSTRTGRAPSGWVNPT
jgi:hypothetical protein